MIASAIAQISPDRACIVRPPGADYTAFRAAPSVAGGCRDLRRRRGEAGLHPRIALVGGARLDDDGGGAGGEPDLFRGAAREVEDAAIPPGAAIVDAHGD